MEKVRKLLLSLIANRPLIVLGGGAVLVAMATVFCAVVFIPSAISFKVQNKIKEMTTTVSARGDSVTSNWMKFETSYLTLEKATVALGEVDGSATGGGIDQFGNTLLYAAANGIIGFLDLNENTIEYTDVRVPMNYEIVRRDYFKDQPAFNQNWYRVTDILVAPTDRPDEAHLYAAHHFFEPETMDICLRVSRIEMLKQGGNIQFGKQGWKQVSELDACVNMEEWGWKFSGHMTGGRMALKDVNTLMISVGTYALGNFEKQWDLIQADSGNHLGKIVSIDLITNEAVVFASGVRNPQGLAFDNRGRLWEAEHGALSGDEVNLIELDKDYGWPNVSYGFDYGAPRTEFELNPVQGRHEGYAKPMYSFVPAIGVSNVIPIDGAEGFELWAGDVLALSLKDETIYRLRPDDGRIVYAEPIEMGQRMRDGLVLENGWIAILTGDNSVFFIRPVADANSSSIIEIAGYDSVLPLEAAAAQFEREFSWGRMLFSGKCASCHEIDEKMKVGRI